MVDYPTDLDINEEKDVHLDASNDLATTSGIEQLQQSVGIDVIDELRDFVAGRLTGENIGQLEEAIRRGLDEDPQLASVQNVKIDTFNRSTSTVKIDVTVVQDDNFSLEIST